MIRRCTTKNEETYPNEGCITAHSIWPRVASTDKIQQLEKAGLSSSTPHNPHIVKVLNRLVPIGQVTQTQNSSAVQSTSAPGVKSTPAPPDRFWSVEAEIASVQWLTKPSQCLVLLDYSLNSFECKTYIKKVLVHQRKNWIRAMQPLKIM